MTLVDIIAVLILFFSVIGGMKEGGVKNFFNLLALLIAIPVTGRFYSLIANLFAFLPGTNWENFIGFFITLALVSALLHLAFFLPRKIAQTVWGKGVLSGLLGGAINLFNAGIGLALATIVLKVYPIIDWLAVVVTGSKVLVWLVAHLGFVSDMLPEVFQQAATFI